MNDQEFFEEFGFLPQRCNRIDLPREQVWEELAAALREVHRRAALRKEVEAIKRHSQELYDKFTELQVYGPRHDVPIWPEDEKDED